MTAYNIPAVGRVLTTIVTQAEFEALLEVEPALIHLPKDEESLMRAPKEGLSSLLVICTHTLNQEDYEQMQNILDISRFAREMLRNFDMLLFIREHERIQVIEDEQDSQFANLAEWQAWAEHCNIREEVSQAMLLPKSQMLVEANQSEDGANLPLIDIPMQRVKHADLLGEIIQGTASETEFKAAFEVNQP